MPIEAAVATLVCVIAIVAVAAALGFFQAAPTANVAVSISDSFVVRCHLGWGIIMLFEGDGEL
jgi:hypothetical protein